MKYFTATLKWAFTWFLAALPALLHLLTESTKGDNILVEQICGKGDLFVISIVMVAEPLSNLVFSKAGERIRYVFFVVSFVTLVVSIALFVTVDSNPQFAAFCKKEDNKSVGQTVQINFFSKCDTDAKFSRNYMYQKAYDSIKIDQIDYKNIKNINEQAALTKKRLIYGSFGTLFGSFIIGLTLVIFKTKHDINET